jgi:hypothetical protein
MSDLLNKVKRRISTKYLGKAGIHGVGIRRSQNALCLYLDTDINTDQKKILQSIEQEAVPYKVLIISENKPKIQ